MVVNGTHAKGLKNGETVAFVTAAPTTRVRRRRGFFIFRSDTSIEHRTYIKGPDERFSIKNTSLKVL